MTRGFCGKTSDVVVLLGTGATTTPGGEVRWRCPAVWRRKFFMVVRLGKNGWVIPVVCPRRQRRGGVVAGVEYSVGDEEGFGSGGLLVSASAWMYDWRKELNQWSPLAVVVVFVFF